MSFEQFRNGQESQSRDFESRASASFATPAGASSQDSNTDPIRDPDSRTLGPVVANGAMLNSQKRLRVAVSLVCVSGDAATTAKPAADETIEMATGRVGSAEARNQADAP